jgi:hypothetical protein
MRWGGCSERSEYDEGRDGKGMRGKQGRREVSKKVVDGW